MDPLRTWIEQAAVGIAQVDLRGRLMHVNPRFSALLGRPPGDLVGRTMLELVHPDDASRSSNIFERLLSTGSAGTMQKRLLRADGSSVTVKSTEWLVADGNGAPRFAVEVIDEVVDGHGERGEARELEDFLETADIAVLAIDGKGVVREAHTGENDILGYAVEDYLGRPFSEFHFDRFANEDVMNRLKGGATISDYEVRLRHKDGSTRHVLMSARGQLDAGDLRYAHVLLRDITAQKGAMEAQRRSDARLRAIADALPALVSFITPDLRYEFANRAFEAWFGIPITEVIGKPVVEVVGASNYELLRPRLVAAMAGERVSFDAPIRGHDGAERMGIAEYLPQLSEDGKTVTGVVALMTDVSDRRRADEARASLAAIVESSTDAIIGASLTGSVVTWNAGAVRIFGLDAKQAIGRPIASILGTTHAEDIRRHIGEVQNGNQVRDLEIDVEDAIGWRRFVSLSLSPIRSSSSAILGISLIARDITKRKHVESELAAHQHRLEELVSARTDELRQSLEKLRRSERLASIGTLAAGIAHEINNPLNAILMSAQFALDFKDEVDVEKTLRTIGDEAQRGGRIVRSILKFSRDERSSKATGDLNQVVHRAVHLTTTYVASSHLIIDLDLSETPCWVVMDATEIEQVLVNLLKNAAEAARDKVHVVIRTICMSSMVRLTVTDDGVGIPEDTVSRIFDPFFSTRRMSGGTGLGLSISHGIITEHGGTISVSSDVGKGTQFTIDLPPSKPPSEAS